MNGCLMVNGYFPITVLNQNSEEFHRELGLFYESGNANDMFRFFQKTIQELYSKEHIEGELQRDSVVAKFAGSNCCLLAIHGILL